MPLNPSKYAFIRLAFSQFCFCVQTNGVRHILNLDKWKSVRTSPTRVPAAEPRITREKTIVIHFHGKAKTLCPSAGRTPNYVNMLCKKAVKATQKRTADKRRNNGLYKYQCENWHKRGLTSVCWKKGEGSFPSCAPVRELEQNARERLLTSVLNCMLTRLCHRCFFFFPSSFWGFLLMNAFVFLNEPQWQINVKILHHLCCFSGSCLQSATFFME